MIKKGSHIKTAYRRRF